MTTFIFFFFIHYFFLPFLFLAKREREWKKRAGGAPPNIFLNLFFDFFLFSANVFFLKMTENHKQTEKTQKREKKPEPKKSCFEKLGIYINVARVALCLNQKGANSGINNELIENQKKIDEVKKLTNYASVSLAVKMYKKVSTVIGLLEENNRLGAALSTLSTEPVGKKGSERERAEKRIRNNSEAITAIFTSLREGGISKPIMVDVVDPEGKPVLNKSGKPKKEFSKERALTLFSTLYSPTEDLEELKKIEGSLLREFKDHIAVYAERSELMNGAVKFNTSVKASVSYLLQEAVGDILKYALRDAKKNGAKKVDLYNLRTEVINQSPFAILFFGLPVVGAVEDFLIRKKIYDEDKIAFDNQRILSKRGKKSIVKSFEEVERSEGHFIVTDKKKKIWKGISVPSSAHGAEEGVVSFVTYVVKIFDTVRSKVGGSGVGIATRAREMVSNLMWQFLNKLSQRFDIHRNHKSTLNPEKNISFETAVEVFEIVLCSNDKTVTGVIDHARKIKQKLRDLKKKTVVPQNAKEQETEKEEVVDLN